MLVIILCIVHKVDPLSLTDAGGMLNAIAEDIDEDDDCSTPPRLKKSKGTHAGAV